MRSDFQPSDPKQYFFGCHSVSEAEKTKLVSTVFDSVSQKYDLMNDLMSLGIHRLWKRMFIQRIRPRSGQTILDVAAGTGDISKQLASSVGPQGRVILTDINASMLEYGRDQLINAGLVENIAFILADAEHLPFTDNTFDTITIAFGLRNITHPTAALRAMQRVLKPGGGLFILEFSHPPSRIFKKLYDCYSLAVIPALGRWIAKDRRSYQYLVESIRMHPDQNTLKNMMVDSGFETVSFENFSGGIVALHKGYKY